MMMMLMSGVDDNWWCFIIFAEPSTAGLEYGALERDGKKAAQRLEYGTTAVQGLE